MEGLKQIIELPEWIPVLPVRNTVLFPNAAVPLIVGRTRSVQSIKQAQKNGDLLLVVTQKDASQEEPSPEGLYLTGVICQISKVTPVDNDGYQLIANGLFRFRILAFAETEPYLTAKGFQLPDPTLPTSAQSETLCSEIKQLGKSILSLAAIPGSEALVKLFGQIQDPSQIADLACTFLHLPIATKQELLEMDILESRLEALLDHMVTEKDKLLLSNEIQAKMMERLSKDQRDHLLREQLRTIHEELGDDHNVQDEFTKRIEETALSPEARKIAKDELSRLNLVQRASPEYHVIRTYLDWLLSMPWEKFSAKAKHQLNLNQARQLLEAEHFGIEKVKKRILEFLAVTKLKKDLKGSILCLVGPPGVGKTSIAKSIAKALGREFTRASLGGVRDEAEIRGHRRTYIGALPGRIVQSLKRVGVSDPLILLDEIDKMGHDFRGDPGSALLEVLDPEQNHTFTDHYLDVAFDLSRIFFVTTANTLDTIPTALRDRMEIIEMTSYSKAEKCEIAKRHLLPKVLKDHGIQENQFSLSDDALSAVIEGYTREAGVRNLQRELAHLCRAAAVLLAAEPPTPKVEFTPIHLEEVLGPKKFFYESIDDSARPGIVTGLAWTPVGGEILNIEVTQMEGKGNLLLTGQLGDVMKESAQIALSLVRSRFHGKEQLKFDRTDFHIHVPSGAIAKDGPSAGVAIFLSLCSLIENKPVPQKFAFTGEVTLRGLVMPVGGIKEKILAAHRAGIETVVLPQWNEGDLKEVSPDVLGQLRFHFVKDVNEVLSLTGFVAPLSQVSGRPIPQVEISSPTLSH